MRPTQSPVLSKLRQVAPALLPFVRLFYGQPSVYCWWDDTGTCRDICQAEGCEQGDALAPALFSLGQHDGLERAAAELRPGEELLAYLDDLYVITSSARAKPALDVVATRVEEHCGIASNVGKTRIYNTAGGPAPRGAAELGEEVWRSDRPLPERGFTALGVPIGHGDYVREWGQRRLREEQALLDHLPHLPDLQCAWLLLLMCASTRANHALRNIPPEDVRHTPRDATVQCARRYREQTAEGEPLASTAWAIAATPATHGGLGLQSAMRTAPAAYWGAWADMLGYWHVRQPRLASELLSTSCAAPCARRPGLATGLTAGSSTHRVHVHAHSTFAIACCCPPWSPAHQPPRGSRLYPLPLRLGPRICGQHGHGCRRRLDPWGDHALACTRSGLLARRAKLVEQAWLAVCREAVGAEGHVVPQQWLSHTSARCWRHDPGSTVAGLQRRRWVRGCRGPHIGAR